MSHGEASLSKEEIAAIVQADRFRMPEGVNILLWALIVAGVATFVRGLGSDDPQRIWLSLHVNFTYWTFFIIASTSFSAVFHICNAQWARPVRRIFESASGFVWYLLPVLALLYFGNEHLFSWSTGERAGKGVWLNPELVYLRDFLFLLAVIVVSKKVVFHSVQRDILAIRGGLTGLDDKKLERWQAPAYSRYLKGTAENAKEAISKATDIMGRISPVVIILYALLMSFIAFDQIMSVDPHWYSTMFGGFVFMSGVYLAVTWTQIGVGLASEAHPLFREHVKATTLHDLGKLVFGFGIFWAYLFWSHYLPIWYGNIPEETTWIIVRLREKPWHSIAWMVFGCCFITPFIVGLSRDIKKVPVLFFGLACIIIAGLWLQFYLLFAPTLYPKQVPIGWQDVLIGLGFLGGILLTGASFLAKVPLIPFGDLLVEEPH